MSDASGRSRLVLMTPRLSDDFVQLGLSPLSLTEMKQSLFLQYASIFDVLPLLCVDPVDACGGTFVMLATWLILPVVIRSSQRLSHACLSINILL